MILENIYLDDQVSFNKNRRLDDGVSSVPSVDDDGEAILAQMDRDYANRPELDRYDVRGIDDLLQHEISLDDRAHAEEELIRRV